MPDIKDFAMLAAIIAADGVTKGKGLVNKAIAGIAAGTAVEAADSAAKKVGLLQKNRFGEWMLKLPLLKNSEQKIEEKFALHPERKKVCFHFSNSIRDGVPFYDPDGNKAFEIRPGKKNLKRLELYQGDRFAGWIAKHLTIKLNPLHRVQKYDALIHNSTCMINVEIPNAWIEGVSWKMEHKFGGDYIVYNRDMEEIARFYSLGFFNFVFDYDDTVDPAEMILTFMAIKIRIEEERYNHRKTGIGHLEIDDAIGDLLDIFR